MPHTYDHHVDGLIRYSQHYIDLAYKAAQSGHAQYEENPTEKNREFFDSCHKKMMIWTIAQRNLCAIMRAGVQTIALPGNEKDWPMAIERHAIVIEDERSYPVGTPKELHQRLVCAFNQYIGWQKRDSVISNEALKDVQKLVFTIELRKDCERYTSWRAPIIYYFSRISRTMPDWTPYFDRHNLSDLPKPSGP